MTTYLTKLRILRGSIKKYKDNVAVYHIFFMKVKPNRLICAPTLILLICEVLIHLTKSHFCYFFLKTTCFVTTAHGNGQNMASSTHSLLIYPIFISRLVSFLRFTLQNKMAPYHLPSYLHTFVRES